MEMEEVDKAPIQPLVGEFDYFIERRVILG
jgi:hypothetical protein